MIPVCEPLLREPEIQGALACMRSGWISSDGPAVASFENAWADYCGVEFGVAVSSGTAALFAAVASLQLEPGDEVIMPSFTIIACAHAILEAGATPVLVDCTPPTWCMDVDEAAARVTPRTRAIKAVHIYGHPVDMAPLRALAARHDLAIIEDAAEAHGAEYRGQRAGSLGDLACFSFYANKIVTTGEGGMLMTNDAEIAARARSYRNLGFRRERRFFHTDVGYNHRLTSIQAAIGLAQIETIEQRVARKREIARRYGELLAGIEGLELPVELPWARNVYWMYGVVVGEELGCDAAGLAERLRHRGIATRPFFLGMHEQPVFLASGLFAGERHPVTERIARQGLYLPSGLTLGDDDIEAVAEAVREELEA